MTAGDMTSILHDIGRSYNTDLRRWSRHGLTTKFHVDQLLTVCIVEKCKHFVAVKDGAIYDSWDSRGKTKKLKEVCGIWCHDDVWDNFVSKRYQ